MAALERSKSRANSFPRCLTPHAESPFCISLADPDLRKLSSDTVSAVSGIQITAGSKTSKLQPRSTASAIAIGVCPTAFLHLADRDQEFINRHRLLLIPPTAVGGSFKSDLFIEPDKS